MLNTLFVKGKIVKENKPVQEQDRTLSNYFHTREPGRVKTINFPGRKKRTRLVVKKGAENISIPLENIVLFHTENKIVFVIDREGKKYVTRGSLFMLEPELDSNIFFRANRQYIINIGHVKSFRTYERVKLKVDMNSEELNNKYFIIISQETAPAFRKWIYEA
ncbi:MAG TPA: LytTR family DNA-binding domain-containing protein [Chitinophagaceae bacterium]